MTSLVLGGVGAVVGSFFGMAPLGFALGSALGSYIDQSKQKFSQEGPRLSDRRVQSSTYGMMIPIVHGTIGVAGNIIWASDLQEESTTEEQGGKGGGPTTTVTTYAYFANFAVSLCEGEIQSVSRIWANGRLWYDANAESRGYTDWRLYTGTETQMPDPTIESFRGAGNVPAYRGQAYIVFTHLPVAPFGNAIPQLFFEVCESALTEPEVQIITDRPPGSQPSRTPNYVIYGSDGALWHMAYASNPFAVPIYHIDAITGDRLSTWTHSAVGFTFWAPAPGGRFWGNGRNGIDPAPVTAHGANAGLYLIDPHVHSVTPVRATEDGSVEYATAMSCPFGDDLLGIAVEALGAESYYPVRCSSIYASSVRGPLLGDANDYDIDGNREWGTQYAMGATDGSYYYAAFTGAVNQPPTDRYHLLRFSLADLSLVSEHTAAEAGIATNLLYHAGSLYVAGVGFIDKWEPVTMTRSARLTYTPTIAGGPKWLSLDEGGRFLHSGAGTTALTDNAVFVDPVSFTEISRITLQVGVVSPDIQGIGPFQRDPFTSRVMGAGYTPTEVVYRLVSAAVDSQTASLAEVVADFCDRVGLSSSQRDVSQLAPVEVRGTVLSHQCSARQAIEPLASAYFFDGIESGALVKFVKRGGTVAVTIPEDDLAWEGGEDVPRVSMQRIQDVDLPHTVNVLHFEPGRDYQQGTQYARRFGGFSDSDLSVEIPAALNSDEAKTIAEAWLYNAWVERQQFQFATAVAYSALEPTDLVSLKGYTIRLNRRTEEGLLMRWTGVNDASQIYLQQWTGVEGSGAGDQTPPTPQPSTVLYLDIPLLRDLDDHPGFYISAAGTPPAGWPGASVYKSSDGGLNYSPYYTITSVGIFGTAGDALASWQEVHHIFDETNTVTVTVNGELAGTTELAVLNGANYALVGNEVIQFKLAELVSTGVYRLSGLLRGQLGTEWANGTHAAGDRFVLLSQNLRDTPHAQSENGVERHYASATIGWSLEAGSRRSFTNTGVRHEPYAPVDIGGGREGTTNAWVIKWKRRTRLSDGWIDQVDAPLGETAENYEVDIMQSTTVKRTLTSSTATVTYTGAQQTSDFGGLQTSLSVRVYQLSSVTGRGYPGIATLPAVAAVG